MANVLNNMGILRGTKETSQKPRLASRKAWRCGVKCRTSSVWLI